jgi:hypothetical protein
MSIEIRQLNDSEIDYVTGGTNDFIQSMRSEVATELVLNSIQSVRSASANNFTPAYGS